MRKVFFTKQFKKDYKKIKNSGKNISLLKEVITKLTNGEYLNSAYHDHALQGDWQDCRDCHIQGDWILIYKLVEGHMIYFERTGSHSELFK